MSNKILHKRSSVASKVPLATDLTLGELSINTADGKIFIKKDNGTVSVVEVGAGASAPTTITGDVAGTGTGTVNVTLPTVNSNVGSFNKVTVNAKGQVTAASNATSSDVIATLGYTPVNSSAVGTTIATLTSGKLAVSQIPDVLVGAVQYQGTWNATTNVPALANGAGIKGQYYKVSVGGTTNIDGGQNWTAGDSIIFNGTTWDGIDGNASEVVSINGRTGPVTLTAADIGDIDGGSY